MKKVRDPIHNYIALELQALRLVDTPRFQRLRNIHQLGTARLVYPGANHTRFEHSLGVYHLAQHASESLGLGDEGLEVRLAGLLHDVGHGPFSHLSETLLEEHLGKSHAEISEDLVRRGSLREPVEEVGADPDRVADLLRGRGVLGELVAGEIDVDRLDYLVRDGHYTGVSTGVDLEGLVDRLTIADDHLALREGGLHAAEALLTTRFLMAGTVYLHHAARVSETMLERAIHIAVRGGEIGGEELAAMDDVALVARLRESETDARALMAAVETRRLHKVAYEASLEHVGPVEAERLAGDRGARDALADAVAEAAGVPTGTVLVDAPEPPVLPEGDVRVLLHDGALVPLRERSQLVAILSPAYLDSWRLRVLAPPPAREAVGLAAQEVLEDAGTSEGSWTPTA